MRAKLCPFTRIQWARDTPRRDPFRPTFGSPTRRNRFLHAIDEFNHARVAETTMVGEIDSTGQVMHEIRIRFDENLRNNN